jgi:SpoVK/Ycf46/Vps4 family AAA+-type ATPase
MQKDFGKLIATKTPIVYVHSWEEDRVETILKRVVEAQFKQKVPVVTWSCTQGFSSNFAAGDQERNPVSALSRMAATKETVIFLFKDPHPYFGEPQFVRAVKDVFQAFKGNYRTLFFLSPTLTIPHELSKEISLLEMDLPTYAELESILDQNLNEKKGVQISLNSDEKSHMVLALAGLTSDEADLTIKQAFYGQSVIDHRLTSALNERKIQLVKKEAILEFVAVDTSMEQVGGLENLKEWLRVRAKFFSKQADEYGLQTPKGLLMTGISGCGKSLAVKAIAAMWEVPLLRLDMNLVYSGMLHSPEESIRRALKTAEAVAPTVLWIDEIEMGLAWQTEGGDRGVTARLYSTFLTWMQEKTKPVFVAATANEINLLPPELLRKGRFDEIFFVDLPSQRERLHILKIHLSKRKNDISRFNLENFAKATEGFNGSELEQCVISAMYKAYGESRKMNENDLLMTVSSTVPLSKTMAEAIKTIKRWADDRAVKASA